MFYSCCNTCVSNQKTYNTHELIKFDDVRTSIGIKNLSTFKTSGKFSCEADGLYHISVHVVSSNTGSYYSIYKSNNRLITIYDDHNRSGESSAGVVVVEMNVGDTISVTTDTSMYIYSSHWSCITIAMIK